MSNCCRRCRPCPPCPACPQPTCPICPIIPPQPQPLTIARFARFLPQDVPAGGTIELTSTLFNNSGNAITLQFPGVLLTSGVYQLNYAVTAQNDGIVAQNVAVALETGGVLDAASTAHAQVAAASLETLVNFSVEAVPHNTAKTVRLVNAGAGTITVAAANLIVLKIR